MPTVPREDPAPVGALQDRCDNCMERDCSYPNDYCPCACHTGKWTALAGETLSDLAARAAVDDAAARWWYTFGRQVGWREGYTAAVADLDADREAAAQARRQAAARVVALAGQPTCAELATRRGQV